MKKQKIVSIVKRPSRKPDCFDEAVEELNRGGWTIIQISTALGDSNLSVNQDPQPILALTILAEKEE